MRPGDEIHLEGEVIELVPSRSKPQGIARLKWTALNQRGEAVYSVIPLAIVPLFKEDVQGLKRLAEFRAALFEPANQRMSVALAKK